MYKKFIILAGLIVGILGVLLVKLGNPPNMGVCVACFYRDIAGALGLHKAAVVQYIRPEILGFILGGFITAFIFKEFKPRGGSSPFLRFILGFFVMVGALVFLGCPLRMVYRLAGGDLNAVVGLLGFIVGIYIGIQFLKKGFTLGRSYPQKNANGYALPIIAILLLIFVLIKPAFIAFSEKGPGAMHAPVIISLAAGLIVGYLAQRSRLCMVGGIRDVLLLKDFHLISGFVAIFIAALIGNIIFGSFNPGFADQPIAHNNGVWNFLGMLLAGLGSVLLGGCPLRQTILAGEGDSDSAITIMGYLIGAAFAHNFSLAASPKGVPTGGQVAVIIGLVVVFAIGFSGCLVPAFKAQKSSSVKGGVADGN